MRCDNCGWENPDEIQMCEKCGTPLSYTKMNVVSRAKVVRFGTYIDNDVVINDRTVSKNHVQISLDEEDRLTILDLQSTNGTYVNGLRIDGEVELHFGDIVKIGNTTLHWEYYFLTDALHDLSNEPPIRPPFENAMCYCPAPLGWIPKDAKQGKESTWQRTLAVITIVIISSVVLGLIIAFILL